MTGSNILQDHCVGIGRRALHQLRLTLERELGSDAASSLQEAGFAAGDETFAALESWIREQYGVETVADLDTSYLNEALAGFFHAFGWGSLEATALSAAVLALDSPDWAEADPASGGELPGCHLSSGLLSDVFRHVTGSPVAVMEVECRTRGDARCRFLLGAPESLSALYNRMAQGLSYEDALGQDGAA